MRYVGGFAGSFLCFLALTGAAAYADGPAWPRHLVYKVGVSNITTNEELVSGGLSGGQVAQSSGGMMANGTVTADIVGFTPDRALRIQIQERTDTRNVPMLSVDVTADGLVRVAPDKAENITEEEHALLQMLSQQFVAPDSLIAGKWNRHAVEGHSVVDEDYRVVSTDPGRPVNIEMDQRIVVRDASPYDTTAHVKIAYDYRYKIPRSVVWDARTHSEGVQETGTRDFKFHYDLVQDSWEPAPAK